MASAEDPRTDSSPSSPPFSGESSENQSTLSESSPPPPLANNDLNDNQSSTTHIRLTATIRSPAQPQQPQAQQQPTNNNNGEFPQQTQNLFMMRDRLFLALFFRVSLIYARTVPKTLRRVFEFFLLMQALLLLFTLGYIHVIYTQTPITCLSEYKESWPRDGILRVEITAEPPNDYNIAKSYEKEERLRQRAAASQMGQYGNDDLLSLMLTADTWKQVAEFYETKTMLILNKMVSTASGIFNSVASSSRNPPEENENVGLEASLAAESLPELLKPSESESSLANVDDNTLEDMDTAEIGKAEVELDSEFKSSDEVLAPGVGETPAEGKLEDIISPSFVHTASGEGNSGGNGNSGLENFEIDTEDPGMYFNKTLEEIDVLKQENALAGTVTLKSSISDFEMFANSVWLHDQAYIVEYSLEYGFLRLTPETRQKLNIPVKIVTLDPNTQPCFGDNFSRFLLDHFLGYDDILMSSIKNLAENEENKGYLRNVVTGEQFRFVPMWMARSAYIPALLIMLVFTVSISMLLRYSHHQIFVFIVDLLNNIEGAGAIHVPAAPLFTVILALVGMEAIMSEFFNDTSTAFYVILIVWIADQYDSVCSHTSATRTYWVRFFYLYHFAFYAYHYRFNGQYGGLALLVSWSFIQHSMIYFYHHYELPTILRQAHQGDEPARGPSTGPGHSPSTPPTVNNGGHSQATASGTVPTSALPNQGNHSSASSAFPNSSDTSGSRDESSDDPAYNITRVSAEISYTRSRSSPVRASAPSALSTQSQQTDEMRLSNPRQENAGGSHFPTVAPDIAGFGLRMRNNMATPQTGVGTMTTSTDDELD